MSRFVSCCLPLTLAEQSIYAEGRAMSPSDTWNFPDFLAAMEADEYQIISCHSPSGHVKYISGSVLPLLGYTPEEITDADHINYPISPNRGVIFFRPAKNGRHIQFQNTFYSKTKCGDVFTIDQVLPSEDKSIAACLHVNPSGCVVGVSDYFDLRLGSKDIINCTLTSLLAPEHESFIMDAVLGALWGKSYFSFYTYYTGHGSTRTNVSLDFHLCVENHVVLLVRIASEEYAGDMPPSVDTVNPFANVERRLREMHNDILLLQDFRDNALLPMYSVDITGKIVWANEAMITMMGYEDVKEDYIGSQATKYHVDQELVLGMLDTVLSGRSLKHFPCDLIRRDGTTLHVIYNSNGHFDSNGVFTHSRCIVQDITEKTRLERERDEMARERQQAQLNEQVAIEASKAKTDFLAVMSHELRTPINGVQGAALLLETTALTDEQKEYVLTIADSTAMLLSLIHNILDISKIEKGQLLLDNTSFRFVDVVRRCCRVIAGRATEKDLVFVTTIAPPLLGVSVWHKGDPARLNQVLLNFLSNAVKFTHVGKVECRVSIEAVECGGEGAPDCDNILLEVIDTGIGVKDCSSLFTDFVQASPSTFARYGGTGLGLSISRKLMTMMNGSVGMESVVGEGTTVWARFPLQRDSNKIQTPLESGLSMSSTGDRKECATNLETARILVAEDNKVNRKVLVRMLEVLGYGCISVAVDGQEAVEAVKRGWETQNRYDVVLMDCLMPIMDGYEATEVIRMYESERLRESANNSADGGTVIVALTANALEAVKTRCLASGMDDFFTKPVSRDGLEVLMQQWIHKRHSK